MIGSLRGELRRTARRPAVWVCLAVAVALLVGLFYAVVWFVYSHPPPNFQQRLPRGTTVSDLKASLYPPNFHRQALAFTAQLGSALALVLGVLSVGSEYGWNTLKMLFTQRPGRLTVLAAKVAALLLTSLVLALVLMASAALASLALALLDGAGRSLPDAGTMASALLATWLMLSTWQLIGAFLGFAFRQSALAIGLGLVYVLLVEGLLFQLLGLAGGDTVRQLEAWFPASNTQALARTFGSPLRAESPVPQPLVSATHAAALLAVYAAAAVAASAAFLLRRDVD